MKIVNDLFFAPTHEIILTLLVILIVLFLIFLLVREFWCWYWKTSKISLLLEEVSDKLTEQNKLQAKIYKQMLMSNNTNIDKEETKKKDIGSQPDNTWDFATEDENAEG